MSTTTPNRPTNGAGTPQASAGLPQYVQDFVRKPGRLLIDGEWVEATSGKTFETPQPGDRGESRAGGARGGARH